MGNRFATLGASDNFRPWTRWPNQPARGPQFLAELAAATTAAGVGVSSGEAIKEASPRGG